MNAYAASLFDFGVGWINPGTCGLVLTSRCSGHCGSFMLLPRSISDAKSTTQSSSLSFGLSKSPFQWNLSSVAGMLSGALSSSLSTGWPLIVRIWRTFNNWVHPPGTSFAEKGGGKGDYSDNLNAATPLCWKCNHNALTISSVSEMSPMVVIRLICAWDSFWVAHRFWLPCHISNK